MTERPQILIGLSIEQAQRLLASVNITGILIHSSHIIMPGILLFPPAADHALQANTISLCGLSSVEGLSVSEIAKMSSLGLEELTELLTKAVEPFMEEVDDEDIPGYKAFARKEGT